MKKQKLCSVLAAMSLLFGVASCDAAKGSESNSMSVDEISSSNSSEDKVAVAHNVHLNGGDGAYVFVDKPSAVAGESVVVTVVMTDSNYVLKGVKLGEQSLNVQVNPDNDKVTTHGFLMPDEDVDIFVETVLPTKEHLLTFEASDVVEVIGLDDAADTGDIVNFKLRVLSGYALDSVKAFQGSDDQSTIKEIDVYEEGAGEYYFEMPDGDVRIVTEASGAYFKVTADASRVVFTSSYGNEWKASDFVDAFLDEENNFDLGNGAVYRAGSKGVFRAKRPGSNSSYGTKPDCYATHYYVDGIEVYQVYGYEDQYDNEYYAYEFTMPNKNVELTVAVEERKISVNLDLPEQVEGYMYTLDENENEVRVSADDKFKLGDRIYFKANQKESVSEDDYKLISSYASIQVYGAANFTVEREDTYWNSRIDWPSGSNSYIKNVSDGVKYFDIPNLFYVDNTITIKFVVKDMHYLDNTPVVGTWYGSEFYNLKKYSKDVSVEITSGGDLVSTESYLKGEVAEAQLDDNYLKVSCGSYSKTEKTLYVYGSSAVVSYSSASDTPNDCFFLVKDDSITSASDIEYKWYSTSTECVAAAYNADGALLGTLYLNKETTLMIPGVTITVNSGEHFYDEGATFVVTRDGVTYLTIE